MNAEKHSSLLNKVHRNSARKMTRTVQLQAWRVHCPINELPVIGYPCLREELWGRQGANIASR